MKLMKSLKLMIVLVIGVLSLNLTACTVMGAAVGAGVGHELTHSTAGAAGGAAVGAVIGGGLRK